MSTYITCDNCHYTAIKNSANKGWSAMTSFSPKLGVMVRRIICPKCTEKLLFPQNVLVHTKGNVPISAFMKED